MKKVVLITYFFQPSTLTPSQRATYFAENFHQLGYWPIVITREWDIPISSYFDTKIKVGTKVRHVKYDHYEVYYLPFVPGLLDRAYVSCGENFLRPLFLLAKLIDIVLVNFTLTFTSYSSFYPFLKSILQKESISSVLISGAPFYLFKLGFLARKKFGVRWFADYRDDWTTNLIEIQKGANLLRKIVNLLERRYEKKWVNSSEMIISVSEVYTRRISDFLKKDGINVENGFDENIMNLPDLPLFEDFTIVYSGTLYPFQDLSVILDGFESLLKEDYKVKLVFLGSAFDIKEKRRIEDLISNSLKPYVSITERVPRREALNFLKRSHVLLSVSYGNLKGIPSSKLYEYIGLRKPVLLCPSDKDVMQSMLQSAGVGYVADTATDCCMQIKKIMGLYRDSASGEIFDRTDTSILRFSRNVQLQKLRGIL